ncbi:hypothetical protein UA38_04870 [Photobacterium kishitanii]|uniref:Uncharacterized protein n=1 Tax=Photobacterium kishitanii TaxID=318456 RepID=A0AAX0YWQ1_9GAMM|nr:hypothetical protein [Photobacterium kishitanii]KJG59063.1 hypothetical protein UA38_04870 [Photobacterium kishitanii]KJG62012.1 hypothetical protein UA42_06265 [Photobacterium kishitanii]KJG67253.1 hypothetical protein UA40_04880 [Photobacterium kishitanii]PSU23788.1 hypothetical protein CTM84_02460 [Photobacterium kishitanii]PSV15991.1 hypothetical protein C0W59_08550 [Photobacterium kishitanii]
MRKPGRKIGKKIRKNAFEDRFALIVEDYNKAKEILDSLIVGTAEYDKQKKECNHLFAHAERCINSGT